MACNSGGTCQSGCYKDEYSVTDDDQKKHTVATNGEGSNGFTPRDGDHNGSVLCIKCKVNETITSTHPAVTGGGGDGRRFCANCFRSNLFGKFRFAVTSNAMISPSDKVLVAFSGGTSSRVALQFVHEMQAKAQKNFDATASRDRSLPVFGVGVAYIDESSVSPIPSDEFDRAINEMKLIVSSLAPPEKHFHVVRTEKIYSDHYTCAKDPLTELLNAVSDTTGREDLLVYLRMLSLQKVAVDDGYTKVVLGTCTSQLACHVLEATVKGKGFSLAADIQYVDARWDIPVVLPLRDCLYEELTMLGGLDSLKTVEAFQQPRAGINELISSFVKLLREENPSRESTIVRTAGKLKPFCFNTIPEIGNQNDQLASQRRQKKYNLNKPNNESLPPESFCLVCNSPLKKTNDSSLSIFGENANMSAAAKLVACSSCQYQILPKDPSSLEYFYSLLPQSKTLETKGNFNNQKLLREQIQDCMLSDSDDDST